MKRGIIFIELTSLMKLGNAVLIKQKILLRRYLCLLKALLKLIFAFEVSMPQNCKGLLKIELVMKCDF